MNEKIIIKFLKSLNSERKTYLTRDNVVIANINNIVIHKHGNNIVGIAGYRKCRRLGRILRMKEVFIVVKKNYQGRGVGQVLISKLIKKLKKGIFIAEILNTNIPSIKLFEKNNFKIIFKSKKISILLYFPHKKMFFNIFKIILYIPLSIHMIIRRKR